MIDGRFNALAVFFFFLPFILNNTGQNIRHFVIVKACKAQIIIRNFELLENIGQLVNVLIARNLVQGQIERHLVLLAQMDHRYIGFCVT